MRNRLSTAGPLALLALLGGCSMLTPFRKPDVPVAPAWIDTSGTAAPAPAADWWREFHSPELVALMGQLQSDNLDIAAAVARVKEAEAEAKVTGAALLPTVTANAGSTRGATGSNLSGTGDSLYKTTSTADLEASYELDFWGRNAASLAAANAATAASRYDRQVVALTDEATLADDYFDYLASLDRAALARRNLAAAEEIRDDYQAEAEQGTATSVDLAQQETLVATTRAAIPPLEREARADLAAIAILLGETPEAAKLAGVNLDGLAVPVPAPGLPSQLLARRPDVSEAEVDLVAANADIAVARADFFPSVTLTGEGGYQSGALSQLFQPGSLLLSAGASLTQPIFEGGSLSGALEYSRARYDELLADYRQSVFSAFSDVETALNAVQKSDEEERDQDQAVGAARNAYDQVQQQMRGGVATVASVLNTEQSLFQAEDSQLQSRLNHLEASVSLFKALGGGWQDTKE